MRPYCRQVAGQLVLGSAAGIIMNTAVVLPAILLGRAIDRALAFERGQAGAADVGWAATSAAIARERAIERAIESAMSTEMACARCSACVRAWRTRAGPTTEMKD